MRAVHAPYNPIEWVTEVEQVGKLTSSGLFVQIKGSKEICLWVGLTRRSIGLIQHTLKQTNAMIRDCVRQTYKSPLSWAHKSW